MDEFFRFPHTPHLAWLSASTPRADKVLTPEEAQQLLAQPVVAEEKIDGANLGFSVDEHGSLRAQNRGNYLDINNPTGQWKPLRRWLTTHQAALEAALCPHLMLFGEWCYAVHSLRYLRLPDWFLVFDVFDRQTQTFWDVERRNILAKDLGLEVVPERARGRLSLDQLKRLLDTSALTDGPAEGIYVRCEQNGQLVSRAKLVRSEFVQAIEEHWSKRKLEANSLAGTAVAN